MATRSTSLPSNLKPINQIIEEKLKKLRIKEELSTPGSEIISIGLSGLAELYGCINESLTLPLTRQALSLSQHKSCVGDLLKRCSMLLNACTNAKEIVIQQRKAARWLETNLSKGRESSSIEKGIVSYNCSRKEVISRAKGVIMSLKQLDDGSFRSGDNQLSGVIRSLRCVSIIHISVCESLLLFLSMKQKQSLVSRLMNKGKRTESRNKLDRLDVVLKTQFSGEIVDDNKGQIAFKYLKDLVGGMEGIENGLECVCKQLTETKSCLMGIVVSF